MVFDYKSLKLWQLQGSRFAADPDLWPFLENAKWKQTVKIIKTFVVKKVCFF